MGHAMLLVTADSGCLIYSNAESMKLSGQSRIITTGMGIRDDLTFGNPFENGFPANGHGGGISGGVSLTHANTALSIYIRDAGVMVWNRGLSEARAALSGDSLNLIDVTKSSSVGFSNGTLQDRDPLVTPLMTRLLMEFSYRWEPRFLDRRDVEQVSAYRLITLGYRQPLVSKFGLRAKPTFGVSLENGFGRGAMPLRVGWTFGGWERVTSCIEYEAISDGLTFAIWYRAIGDGLFRLRKGAEIGVTMQVLWGTNR
jgi:hypothetical protein